MGAPSFKQALAGHREKVRATTCLWLLLLLELGYGLHLSGGIGTKPQSRVIKSGWISGSKPLPVVSLTTLGLGSG